MPLKRSVLSAALLFALPAAAQDFQAPRVLLSTVDWPAAAKVAAPDASGEPVEILAPLNKALSSRFAGIEKSTVPVLLPVDVAAFRKDAEAGSADSKTSNKYFGEFSPSKLFLNAALSQKRRVLQ